MGESGIGGFVTMQKSQRHDIEGYYVLLLCVTKFDARVRDTVWRFWLGVHIYEIRARCASF